MLDLTTDRPGQPLRQTGPARRRFVARRLSSRPRCGPWSCGGKNQEFTMTRTLLTLAAGAALGVGGLTLAQTGHGHGKRPTVRTLSAVDVAEELNGKPTRA